MSEEQVNCVPLGNGSAGEEPAGPFASSMFAGNVWVNSFRQSSQATYIDMADSIVRWLKGNPEYDFSADSTSNNVAGDNFGSRLLGSC
jgi:hypothetical protein